MISKVEGGVGLLESESDNEGVLVGTVLGLDVGVIGFMFGLVVGFVVGLVVGLVVGFVVGLVAGLEVGLSEVLKGGIVNAFSWLKVVVDALSRLKRSENRTAATTKRSKRTQKIMQQRFHLIKGDRDSLL
jgi:LytS/YehU family sensor histidine kinase